MLDRFIMVGKINQYMLGFDPWVGKVPWRRTWQPTPVLLPRESPWTEEPWQATVHGVAKSQI